MPNWTENRIIMKDIAKEKLFSFDKEGESFDFNKLIPMPESLNVESGSMTEVALWYFRSDRGNKEIGGDRVMKNRVSQYTNGKFGISPEKLYETGKKVDYNLKHYGVPTWYEWCYNNWGTKWNACRTKILDKDTITFDTAWSEPVPVIIELSKRFPDRVIVHEFSYEEDMEIVNEYTYLNGTVVHIDEYFRNVDDYDSANEY